MVSSGTEDSRAHSTEGFVLPPKNSKTPSEGLMQFCDNVVQNSRRDTEESSESVSQEASASGGVKPLYKRQLEGFKKNFEENLYSKEIIRPTLDTSHPLHNFILGNVTRNIWSVWSLPVLSSELWLVTCLLIFS